MALERRFPDRFIPRYSMVMFHPEIPYAEALRRGAIQAACSRSSTAARAASPTRSAPRGWSTERLPP